MKRENLHVYFIKPVGMEGPIKIGCSGNTAKRLLSLASWSPFPLEIIAEIEGDFELERNIHECFADLHLHREWFTADPRLIECVAALANGGAISDVVDLTDRRGKLLGRKPTGGANWAEHTRRYMSLLHRTRFAVRRAERATGVPKLRRPDWLEQLLDEVRAGHVASAQEAQRVAEFVERPERQCLPFVLQFSRSAVEGQPSEAAA